MRASPSPLADTPRSASGITVYSDNRLIITHRWPWSNQQSSRTCDRRRRRQQHTTPGSIPAGPSAQQARRIGFGPDLAQSPLRRGKWRQPNLVRAPLQTTIGSRTRVDGSSAAMAGQGRRFRARPVVAFSPRCGRSRKRRSPGSGVAPGRRPRQHHQQGPQGRALPGNRCPPPGPGSRVTVSPATSPAVSTCRLAHLRHPDVPGCPLAHGHDRTPLRSSSLP